MSRVTTPPVRSGKKRETKFRKNLKPPPKVVIEGETAVINFTPTPQQQAVFAKEFGAEEKQGLSGQFVVTYDVQRDSLGGEVSFI